MSHINNMQSHDLYLLTLPKCLETLTLVEKNNDVLQSLTEYGMQTLNRINGVLNQLKLRLDSVDPLLFRLVVLNQLNIDVNQINSYLQNSAAHFVNDSRLNSINNTLDNLLAQMILILQVSDLNELDGIRENVTSFRRSVSRHKVVLEEIEQELIEKKDNTTREFGELNTSFEELNERFHVISQEFEEKFSDLHNSFIETENERSEQFETKTEENQKAFDDHFIDMEEKWALLLERNEQVINETINDLNVKQEDFLTETLQKQQEYDEILIEHKKSVESLVGIISTNTISGHFKEVADKKDTLTTVWQWLTGGGFAITIGFGVYAFIFSKDLDWPSLIARFIVTTALGSFTAYAARQVTKNEIQEKYNRQMEVELKTLNPYIASFSEEDQIKLKEQLFPHIFGRAEVNNNSVQDKDSSPSSNSLKPEQITNINSIIETLKSLTGSQK